MMWSMRPIGSPESLERRRRKAIGMFRLGHSYRAIAEQVGAALSSVVRWRQSYRRFGGRGLRARPASGRPCRLTNQQKVHLGDTLARGAQAAGYANDLWTLKRIAAVVKKLFGIPYCASGIWRLLVGDLHWSAQKPTRRATQRDEAGIAHWKRYVWPHIKKRLAAARPSGIP
ncbi:MAG: transposase [Chloroflexi bacterium]|nr:transposase [Chloroflexota bacterium]